MTMTNDNDNDNGSDANTNTNITRTQIITEAGVRPGMGGRGAETPMKMRLDHGGFQGNPAGRGTATQALSSKS